VVKQSLTLEEENPINPTTQTPTLLADRLDWYLQAKFGLFVHWGAYSLAGVEASWPVMTPEMAAIMFRNPKRISEAEYTALPARFDPRQFDARAWVRLAQESGMRYIVLTAKHHDGFCMFDAPGTDYKITNTPYGKDICLELAEACAEAGMRLGFYYSPPDMHHPGYRDTRRPVTANWLGEPKRAAWSEYLDLMESHLRKLLTGYGEVSLIWFDGLVNHQKYDPARFHRLIHELSPNTLINDRLGDDYDFITPEQFIPRKGIPVRTGKPPAANQGGEGLFRAIPRLLNVPLLGGWVRGQLLKYGEGETELSKIPQEPNPSAQDFQPWETCMTMGQSWAYNPDERGWKSAEQLVRNLVEVVSRGGNYLLNVGPTPDGAFPEEAIQRLQFVGRWLDRYGEAIFGSSYAAPLNGFAGRVTRKPGMVYLHVLDWPVSARIEIENFAQAVEKVTVLGRDELDFCQDGEQLQIALPAQAPDPVVSVIRIQVREKQ
jgi:alpha-L-fucosidase